MTLAQAQSLYDSTMVKAAEAAKAGRFDSAAGYLSAAAIYWRRLDRKSTRLNSSHLTQSRMPSSA